MEDSGVLQKFQKMIVNMLVKEATGVIVTLLMENAQKKKEMKRQKYCWMCSMKSKHSNRKF